MHTILRSVALAMLVILAVVLGGCTAAMPAQPGAQPSMPAMAEPPKPEPGKLTVANVRARPAPLEGGNGAAFLTVLNGLDTDVQLLSATGDVANAIELHETVDDNGVMKMEPHPEGFTVPAGGILELKPGGKHVMMLGLAKPLAAGDAITLTLNFGNGDQIELNVPVVDMEATMPGMDAGHDMATPKP